MPKKMGFGAVLAIVFGSQIGSGIFVLPATLAPFGMYGVWGWGIAGAGAILLAFVFAELCSRFPKTGGPHVYVRHVFGRTAAFFTGWTYWLVSWTSTSVVIIAAVVGLSPFFPADLPSFFYLIFETVFLLVIAAINCRSVNLAGRVESFLALLKLIPFVIVPAILFCNFNSGNIAIAPQYSDFSFVKLVVIVTAESFWGFIGVECATAPAGAVENPSKTIPRAIIIGTCGVALVYFFNNLAVMGVIPENILAESKSPYADAVNTVLGKNLSMVISAVTFIIMAGTANAWTLASAQTSLGLAQNGLLPAFFAKKNKESAPYVSVLISTLGMIPILVLSQNHSLSEQINSIIGFSVEVFLMVYAVCCAAFIKINAGERKIAKTFLGITAFVFCIIMIANSSLQSVITAFALAAAGVFMTPFIKRKTSER
ncbi:MAG: amino acid permease [Holosporaceae bacterium]|nr:amino acid permease [Holosporaceae bacterium]